MATQTCPACASEVKEADLICFTCGANLPRAAVADNDPPAPVTVMQEYLRAAAPFSAATRRTRWWPPRSPATTTCPGGMPR